MADRIELKGLRAHAFHGCFDYERENGQDFSCDITLWLDFSGAAATDDLSSTVDYGQVAETAYGILTGTPRNLIETVATEIAETLMRDDEARTDSGLEPIVNAVEVTIHKPHAPIPLDFADAAVTARRSRKSMRP